MTCDCLLEENCGCIYCASVQLCTCSGNEVLRKLTADKLKAQKSNKGLEVHVCGARNEMKKMDADLKAFWERHRKLWPKQTEAFCERHKILTVT